MHISRIVKGALMAMSVSIAPAYAQDLRIALGYTDTYAMYQPLENFAATLKEKAGLAARVYPMSLLTLAETGGGVSDGLADVGFVVFPYHAAEFSEMNLPANLSLLATTGKVSRMPGAAMAGATMEYALLNCDDCQDQMRDNNQVYLAGASTPPYQLLCNTPLHTVDHIKGSRLRAGAGNWSRWAEAMGATPISMPGNDIYDAVNQKLVHCTMNAVGDLVGLRYIDIVSDVTLGAPGGVFSGLGAANFNRDTWAGFTDEQRAVIIEASARLAAESVIGYEEDNEEGFEAAKTTGRVRFHEVDADVVAKGEAFVESDLATIAEQFSTGFQVANVEQKIATFRELLEKWKTLTMELGTKDADRLAELYWSEIFSKLDPASYGMN